MAAHVLAKGEGCRGHIQTKQGRKEIEATDSYGKTVLGQAVMKSSPLDVVMKLLEIQPAHSLTPDKYGMLPLHYACFKGLPSDVSLSLLMHDNGASARALDCCGNCPLHLLVENLLHSKECRKASMTSKSGSSFLSSSFEASV